MVSYILLVTYLAAAMEKSRPETDTRPFVGVAMQEFTSEDACKAAGERLKELAVSTTYLPSFSNLARQEKPRPNSVMTTCVPK